jgi:hypothetical protein
MRSAPSLLLGASLFVGAALSSSAALAGGLGVVGSSGFHTDPVYAYDLSDTQYRVTQMRPHYGAGIQAVLGDRDDRFVGLAKFYWVQDAGQVDNDIPAGAKNAGYTGDASELSYAVRETPINVGMATAGVQWGLWGDPLGFQVNAISCIGAAWATADAREFLFVEVGPGFHYSVNNRIQVNAELAYQMRYRKGFEHGVNLNAGVRFLFD